MQRDSRLYSIPRDLQSWECPGFEVGGEGTAGGGGETEEAEMKGSLVLVVSVEAESRGIVSTRLDLEDNLEEKLQEICLC